MKHHGIDILRGIAAFGIVGCHLGLNERTSGGAWVTALCNFNVGMFAVISGFLMSTDGGGWEYVKKRAKRLLPTYLAWSLVYLVATAAFDLVLDGGQLNERYYRPLYWIRVLFWGSAATHLWFLICLFYGQIILKSLVGMMEMMKTDARINGAVLSLISLSLLFCSVCWDNWYCLYPIRLIAFLILGYVMKGYAKNLVVIPFVGVAAMMAVHLGLHGILPGFVRDYLLAIPVMMLFVSDSFKDSKLATSLAATSMGVYLIHPLFARGASFVMGRISTPPYGVFAVVGDWVAVWTVSLLAVLILRKICPLGRFIS